MKKIVVYYSYTGNTRIVANDIAKKLSYEIMELKPTIPFSNDYQEVVDEWQNNSVKRDVEIKPLEKDLSDYDEIIVCSPIWWYTITPVITSFLKTAKLSGKTIYPVMTSAGWFGHSTQDVKKLCPNSTIMPTLEVTFDEDYNTHRITEYNVSLDIWLENVK